MNRSYFFKKRRIRFCFQALDFLLKIFHKKKALPFHIESLLLSHPAHLGDVILMTSLLPLLKDHYPRAKIGVLVSPQSAEVVKNHHLIDKIHKVSHWKTNRSPISFLKKILIYRREKKTVMNELKGYQISIDCNFHFPNFAILAWRAKIPIRIGYRTAGCSPLLTHALEWETKEQSAAAYFLDLLKMINPEISGPLKPSLPPRKIQTKFFSQEYLVLHMGTGDPQRKWPQSYWQKLIDLMDYPAPLVMTGRGVEELKEIISMKNKNIVNLCDQLSWDEYVALIEGARYYLGVESCGGHVASAFDIPSLVIYKNSSTLWKPLSKRCLVLVEPSVEEAFDAWNLLTANLKN